MVYVAMYFIMPGSVDETMEIGLYAPGWSPALDEIQQQGLEIRVAESRDDLEDGVIAHDYVAGIGIPGDLMEKLASGQRPQIDLYFASDTPEEAQAAVSSLVRELIYAQTGQPLAVDFSTQVLPGPDMAGEQIPPRDRMRPLFAVLLIVFETYGMATLITEEIERRTIQALLVTPVSVKDLFAAKGITGMTLAFGQGALFMALVGGLNRSAGDYHPGPAAGGAPGHRSRVPDSLAGQGHDVGAGLGSPGPGDSGHPWNGRHVPRGDHRMGQGAFPPTTSWTRWTGWPTTARAGLTSGRTW